VYDTRRKLARRMPVFISISMASQSTSARLDWADRTMRLTSLTDSVEFLLQRAYSAGFHRCQVRLINEEVTWNTTDREQRTVWRTALLHAS
jgi:hypothetical protein